MSLKLYMKSIREFLRKTFITKKWFFQILGFYFGGGIVLMLILTVTITHYLISHQTKSAVEWSNTVIKQTYTSVNTAFQSTFQNCREAFTDNDLIEDALNNDRLSDADLDAANKTINNLVAANPLISSIYYINYNAYIVMDGKSAGSLGSFYDQNAIMMLGNYRLSSSYNAQIYLPRKAVLDDPQKTAVNYISVFFLVTRNDTRNSAMIVNISADNLQQFVPSDLKNRIGVTVVNSGGYIISDTDAEQVNSTLEFDPVYQEIMQSSKASGYFYGTFGPAYSLISYYKSKTNGILYICSVPYDYLTSDVHYITRFITMVTLAFLLLSSVWAVVSSRRVYAPIKDLMERIKNRSSARLPSNMEVGEYDFLQDAYTRQSNDVSILTSSLQKFSTAKKKVVLQNLLYGVYMTEGESIRELGSVDIHFPGSRFVVLSGKMDGFREISRHTDPSDLMLVKYGAVNIICEVLGEFFITEGLNSGLDCINIILNANDFTPANIGVTSEKIREALALIRKHLQTSFSFGIGTVADGYGAIQESLSHSMRAVDYRYLLGANRVILYRDIAEREQNVTAYPNEEEATVIADVRRGFRDRLGEDLERFMMKLSSARLESVAAYILQLSVVISRIGSHRKASALEADASLLTTHDSVDESREFLYQLCLKKMHEMSTYHSPRSQDKLQVVESFIQEHLSDPELSVEKLGKLIGYSSNYIWQLFKENRDYSPADYILKCRIEKAQELLRMTHFTGKKISEMTGFLDNRYFYKVFKKQTGMTTEQYRSKYAR